jgi:ubiquinone/menaquinone biosynthesis C-methylase UbiE
MKKPGFENVEFVRDEIEEIPLVNNTYDIVVSNCVLNLCLIKTKHLLKFTGY